MGKLDETHAEGKLLLLASDYLLLALLTVGCMMSFLSAYEIKTDLAAATAFCLCASAASAALHKLSHPWGSLLAAAGIVSVFWLRWEKTGPVLKWIGQKMNLIPVSTGLSIGSFRPEDKTLLYAVLLLCAALAWWMGWAVVRARRWYLAALMCVVVVLPAIQMGVLPSWGAVLATFIGWGAMLLTALFGRKDPGSLARAQLLSLGGMFAFTLALVMALPMEGYTRPQWATDARTNLIRGVTRQLDKFFDLDELNSGIFADLGIDLSLPAEPAAGPGGTGDGAGVPGTDGLLSGRENLLSMGPRRYRDVRILSVRTDQPGGGRVYLRGRSLGTYTGGAWEWSTYMISGSSPFFTEMAHGREATAFPSLYPGRTAGNGAAYTMTIRDISYHGSNFYPYRLVDGYGTVDESGRLTLPWELEWEENPMMTGEDQYQVGYIPGDPRDSFVPLAGELAVEELQYREEVIPKYLEVPDGTAAGLTALLESAGASLDGFGGPDALPEDMDTLERFDAVMAAASRTAALLSELAVYDPDTPAMGQGEDFAVRFLTEGRGYCVHFATAGALLLRMQGIPARYASGYVADLDNQGLAMVLDSDAHAWVEVYINGYGWHPVEMTPGYAGGSSGVELSGAPEVQVPEDNGNPDGPDAVPDEPETPEQEEEVPEDQSDGAFPGGEEAAEGKPFPWKLLAGILLALAALGGVYGAGVWSRAAARTHPDTNRSVIRAYRRYRRAVEWGAPEDEVLEALGRKAKFSQHTLSEEERGAAWTALEAAAEHACRKQPKWRRGLFRLLKPLL